jgi:hypothetical protein
LSDCMQGASHFMALEIFQDVALPFWNTKMKRMNSCDLCARWRELTRASSSSSLSLTPHRERASTSEGPRDVLSEEQLSVLVWTRWVVRMLPYYRAQLRVVQQTMIRGEMKEHRLLKTAILGCGVKALRIS